MKGTIYKWKRADGSVGLGVAVDKDQKESCKTHLVLKLLNKDYEPICDQYGTRRKALKNLDVLQRVGTIEEK